MRYSGMKSTDGALVLLVALKALESAFRKELASLEGSCVPVDVCSDLGDDFYLHYHELQEVLKSLLSERAVAEIERASGTCEEPAL